ncbi:uncharacterized protein LOC116033407 [Ipomoea triloba]|uniref:uncharacterized protein LOC116033407 n=1 Tax=Ipomoea triloba TaxID=35885 RepID=UPI00125DD7E8|nr:uncharacterized protein LOC116033407 [Ipomoea triloba]
MKKLYRKGTVHPTPPLISDHLAFLPAAILTLAAALCQEDKEVLAYLISCSSVNSGGRRKAAGAAACGGAGHPPCFNCNCFSCYMSYWVRWDSSPNRQLIHEIIDAYEDGLQVQSKKMEKNKREKRRNNKANNNGSKGCATAAGGEEKTKAEASLTAAEHRRDDDSSGGEEEEGDGGEKGAVRRIVSFLGERIWTTIWT